MAIDDPMMQGASASAAMLCICFSRSIRTSAATGINDWHITISYNHDDVMKWKIFRVTGPLGREFFGHRWIPLTKASDAELWCFLWSARLSKQSWGWWFETPSCSLWRHSDGFCTVSTGMLLVTCQTSGPWYDNSFFVKLSEMHS